MGLNGNPLELHTEDTWRADEPLTYERVIKRIVKRFIFESQNDAPSNEGDIEELKQDVSSFRYEMLNQLKIQQDALQNSINHLTVLLGGTPLTPNIPQSHGSVGSHAGSATGSTGSVELGLTKPYRTPPPPLVSRAQSWTDKYSSIPEMDERAHQEQASGGAADPSLHRRISSDSVFRRDSVPGRDLSPRRQSAISGVPSPRSASRYRPHSTPDSDLSPPRSSASLEPSYGPFATHQYQQSLPQPAEMHQTSADARSPSSDNSGSPPLPPPPPPCYFDLSEPTQSELEFAEPVPAARWRPGRPLSASDIMMESHRVSQGLPDRRGHSLSDQGQGAEVASARTRPQYLSQLGPLDRIRQLTEDTQL